MTLIPLAALLICLAAASASAEVIIDQECVAPLWASYALDYPEDFLAQTFTAHNTGQITSIALQLSLPNYLNELAHPTDDLHFKLTRTSAAGEPLLTDVLATYDIAPSTLITDYQGLPMREIDLRDQHIEVTAGDVLAMVLSSNYTEKTHPQQQNYGWNFSLYFDFIAGGKFFVYSPKIFGPRWFYQWNTTDPTLTGDAGYRITMRDLPKKFDR